MAGEEREPLLANNQGRDGFTVEQDVSVEAAIPTIDAHDPAEGAALRLGEDVGALSKLLLFPMIFG